MIKKRGRDIGGPRKQIFGGEEARRRQSETNGCSIFRETRRRTITGVQVLKEKKEKRRGRPARDSPECSLEGERSDSATQKKERI